MAEKKTTLNEKISMLSLGVCVDYFIFRKDKKLSTAICLATGFVLGVIHSYGLKNIVVSIQNLFV
jgi:hypothetical protein